MITQNRIDRDTADRVAEFAQASVRTGYSGRAMYGATCVGFVVSDDEDLLLLGAALGREGLDNLIRDARLDSMGRNTIVYFPRYTTTGDDLAAEWEEDEDD